MIERALLSHHSFGFLLGSGVGTLAHIAAWQILDDGRSLVSVRAAPATTHHQRHCRHRHPRHRASSVAGARRVALQGGSAG